MMRAALLPFIEGETAAQLDCSIANQLPISDVLNHTKVTIFVVGGASSGLKRGLTKTRTTIGTLGGGSDIEINDEQVSQLHCVVTATKTEETVRLYDLDSANGTYTGNQRVQAINLDHGSEFRIGSTVFLVTIVSKHSTETT